MNGENPLTLTCVGVEQLFEQMKWIGLLEERPIGIKATIEMRIVHRNGEQGNDREDKTRTRRERN